MTIMPVHKALSPQHHWLGIGTGLTAVLCAASYAVPYIAPFLR